MSDSDAPLEKPKGSKIPRNGAVVPAQLSGSTKNGTELKTREANNNHQQQQTSNSPKTTMLSFETPTRGRATERMNALPEANAEMTRAKNRLKEFIFVIFLRKCENRNTNFLAIPRPWFIFYGLTSRRLSKTSKKKLGEYPSRKLSCSRDLVDISHSSTTSTTFSLSAFADNSLLLHPPSHPSQRDGFLVHLLVVFHGLFSAKSSSANVTITAIQETSRIVNW